MVKKAEETKEVLPEPVETRTKKQIALEEHKIKAEKKAGAAKALKALYLQAVKDPVFQNILKVVNEFAEYHRKLAQDGLGYKEVRVTDSKGEVTTHQEEVELTDTQRVAHLNKAAAQQEILDYIDRQVQ